MPRKVAGAIVRKRPCWLQQACCGLPAGHDGKADAAPGVHGAVLQHPDCLPGVHSQCSTQTEGRWPQHESESEAQGLIWPWSDLVTGLLDGGKIESWRTTALALSAMSQGLFCKFCVCLRKGIHIWISVRFSADSQDQHLCQRSAASFTTVGL